MPIVPPILIALDVDCVATRDRESGCDPRCSFTWVTAFSRYPITLTCISRLPRPGSRDVVEFSAGYRAGPGALTRVPREAPQRTCPTQRRPDCQAEVRAFPGTTVRINGLPREGGLSRTSARARG
jgi:hypothetical protein